MSATLFGQRRRPDATPLVFLLSDGSQTTDGGNSAAIRAAADLKSQGVTLFTWGFGSVLPSVLNSMATGPADLHAFYGNDFSTLRARVDRIIDDTCLLVTQATIEPGCQPGRLVRVYGSGFTRQSARSTTVRFTVSATNTTIDQSGLTFSNATLLSCALPSGSVPVFDPRLGSAAAVPLHSYGGRVEISVSLDGGLTFQSQGAFLLLACASPPPPAPPPPPPSSPNVPRVCWAWGDPHISPFDGAQYDAQALGVRNLARWNAGGERHELQFYSCPTRCDVGNDEWFPCGASSAVAFAGSIFGMHIALVGDDVYVNGVLRPQLSPTGESRNVACAGCPGTSGSLAIERLSDNDPDYRTPGPKLRFRFGDGADAVLISTWKFNVVNMPTGYLNNARLTLPGHTFDASTVDGLCTGAANNMPQSESGDAPIAGAWPSGVLERLASECGSFNGTFTPATGPEELCSSSGIAIDAARSACARYAGLDANRAYAACLVDFCGTGSGNLAQGQDDHRR